MYFVAAVGFVYGRLRPIRTDLLADLIVYIGSPCLAFVFLTQRPIRLEEVSIIVGSGLAVTFLVGALALPILRLLKAPSTVFLPPVIFMNAGNMGMPFALYAFGEAGLSRQVLLYVLGSFLHSSLGVYLVSRKQGTWEFLRLPIVYATLLGVIVNLLGWRPPPTLMRPLELLGAITIPLMILTLGLKLSTVRLRAVKLPLIAALMRLGLGFLVGVVIFFLLGVERLESKVILLYSVLPPAVANFIYAEKFRQNADQVAATIMLGTLISMLSSPLVLYLALRF